MGWLIGAVIGLVFVALASGGASGGGPLMWPVRPRRGIINPFRASREGGARIHAGVDVGAVEGDAIIAMADGRVVRMVTGYSIGAGLGAVAIEHPEFDLLYAEIDTLVKPGDSVAAGDVIGRARRNKDGHTMLHIEAWERGTSPATFTRWMSGHPAPDGLMDVQTILDEVPKGSS